MGAPHPWSRHREKQTDGDPPPLRKKSLRSFRHRPKKKKGGQKEGKRLVETCQTRQPEKRSKEKDTLRQRGQLNRFFLPFYPFESSSAAFLFRIPQTAVVGATCAVALRSRGSSASLLLTRVRRQDLGLVRN